MNRKHISAAQNTPQKQSNVTKLVVTALLSAIAFVLQYIEFSIPIVPQYLKMDFSDIPELIGAFVIGPLGGAAVALIKNLLHLPFSHTSGVGELANFLIGAAFAVCAGLIYKAKKNKTGALLACLCGTLAMTAVSFPINYFIVYPFYIKLMGEAAILGLYTKLLPWVDTLPKGLLVFNMPFTFVKGVVCAVVTFIIYKPLSNMIKELNKRINNKKRTKPDISSDIVG